ncbi:hypothetical protein MRGA423_23220 [Mycobacterium tuberculosis RGTB423]|nr:hypothetical protein MRGA423_23220 [Mycobacterium tuberculosis RGTB423]
MQIADVQHPQRCGARSQDWHGHLAQDECIALDQRSVTNPGDGRAQRHGAGADQGGQDSSHARSLLPVEV